jgi:hypothetical protein
MATGIGTEGATPDSHTDDMDVARIEKAFLEQLCRSRGGFASVVTKTHSEFRRLVEENDFASLTLCVRRLQHSFSEFENAHLQFLNTAKDSAPDRIENYVRHYQDMKRLVSEAYEDYEQMRLQEDIKPSDSASNYSASKASSSSSSARLKVAARKASLLAKAQFKEQEMLIKLEQHRQMKEKLRLEAEINETQLRLESELEMVQLQAEISAAKAEEAALVSSTVQKGRMSPDQTTHPSQTSKGHMSTYVKGPLVSTSSGHSLHHYTAQRGLMSQDDPAQKGLMSQDDPVQKGLMSQHNKPYAVQGHMSYPSSAAKGAMSQRSTYPSAQKGVMSQHSTTADTTMPKVQGDMSRAYTEQEGHMSHHTGKPVFKGYTPNMSKHHESASYEPHRSTVSDHHTPQQYLQSPSHPRFASTPLHYYESPDHLYRRSTYPMSTLNPLADEWKATQGDQRTQPPVPQPAYSADKPEWHAAERDDPELDGQQRMQRQLLDAVSLPRTTMMTFDGDPMSYWMFINAFESCVDSCLVSDSVKLNRLFEYCKGKAAQVIRPCALMQPSEGYKRARRLLRERFGNEFKISEAWIRKVTEGSAIRPNNGGDIQDLADDVRNCAETLRAMDRLEEIDSRVRMVKIVQRLPMYLQSRWTRLSVSVKERTGVYPDILNLVDFLDTVAKEANDPIFGAPALHHEPKTKQMKPKKQGKSFNVQVASTSKKETESNQNRPTPAVQRQCPLCEADHNVTSCGQFKKMSPEKRLEFAKDKKLCFSCLKPGNHTIRWCHFKATCGVNGCTHKHSRLLHTEVPSKTRTNEEKDKKVKEEKEDSDKEEKVEAQSCACSPTSLDGVKIALPIEFAEVTFMAGLTGLPHCCREV